MAKLVSPLLLTMYFFSSLAFAVNALDESVIITVQLDAPDYLTDRIAIVEKTEVSSKYWEKLSGYYNLSGLKNNGVYDRESHTVTLALHESEISRLSSGDNIEFSITTTLYTVGKSECEPAYLLKYTLQNAHLKNLKVSPTEIYYRPAHDGGAFVKGWVKKYPFRSENR